MNDDFRYMKLIYLHCGEEMKLDLLIFFQVLFSTTRFSSVLSCEDLLISFLHRNANI